MNHNEANVVKLVNNGVSKQQWQKGSEIDMCILKGRNWK